MVDAAVDVETRAARGAALEADALARGGEHVGVRRIRGERRANHHAGLRPGVLVGDVLHPCDDVDVARDLLIDEVELIAGAPDVGAGRIDGEDAAAMRGAATERWRADVSADPWRGQRLRIDQGASCKEHSRYTDGNRECVSHVLSGSHHGRAQSKDAAAIAPDPRPRENTPVIAGSFRVTWRQRRFGRGRLRSRGCRARLDERRELLAREGESTGKKTRVLRSRIVPAAEDAPIVSARMTRWRCGSVRRDRSRSPSRCSCPPAVRRRRPRGRR